MKGPQRLAALDGLRALSITLVLLGHLVGTKNMPLPADALIGRFAEFGVRVFFVISGFLISSLLFAEHEKTGTISLRNQLIYASGSFGGNILGRTKELWLLFFYAPPSDEQDMTRLAPVALVGALLLVSRFIEALDDPLIGYWSDRTRTRWGRRIPFVVLATPFYAIFPSIVFPPYGGLIAAGL